MSSNGLITRLKYSNIVENSDNVVCMGATASDKKDSIKLSRSIHNCRK